MLQLYAAIDRILRAGGVAKINSAGKFEVNGVAILDASTGHKHRGTTDDGPKLTHDSITVPYAHAYASSAQSIPASAETAVSMDSEHVDTDNMHFTSAAALAAGTVSKTASSTTLTGSGTSFTTELSVGQMISVPGGTTERRIITAIASDTSLTVNSAFASTASGQILTRRNSPLVCRVPGTYLGVAGLLFDTVGATAYRRFLRLRLNGLTPLASFDIVAAQYLAGPVLFVKTLALWDYVEAAVYHEYTSSLNLYNDANSKAEIYMLRIG